MRSVRAFLYISSSLFMVTTMGCGGGPSMISEGSKEDDVYFAEKEKITTHQDSEEKPEQYDPESTERIYWNEEWNGLYFNGRYRLTPRYRPYPSYYDPDWNNGDYDNDASHQGTNDSLPSIDDDPSRGSTDRSNNGSGRRRR